MAIYYWLIPLGLCNITESSNSPEMEGRWCSGVEVHGDVASKVRRARGAACEVRLGTAETMGMEATTISSRSSVEAWPSCLAPESFGYRWRWCSRGRPVEKRRRGGAQQRGGGRERVNGLGGGLLLARFEKKRWRRFAAPAWKLIVLGARFRRG